VLVGHILETEASVSRRHSRQTCLRLEMEYLKERARKHLAEVPTQAFMSPWNGRAHARVRRGLTRSFGLRIARQTIPRLQTHCRGACPTRVASSDLYSMIRRWVKAAHPAPTVAAVAVGAAARQAGDQTSRPFDSTRTTGQAGAEGSAGARGAVAALAVYRPTGRSPWGDAGY